MIEKKPFILETIATVEGEDYHVLEVKENKMLLSKKRLGMTAYLIAINVNKEGDSYTWDHTLVFLNLEEARVEFEKITKDKVQEEIQDIAEHLARYSVETCMKFYQRSSLIITIAAMINARPKIDEDLRWWALGITRRRVKPKKSLSHKQIIQIWKDAQTEGLFLYQKNGGIYNEEQI